MRAIKIGRPNTAELVDIEPREPAPGEARVTVVVASMCATDRKLYRRGADPPVVPGHEISGRLADGSFVVVHPDIGCGSCSQCRAGFQNRCPDRVSIGLGRDGGFAEQVVVPISHVLPTGGVDVADAALLEPLACVVHAVGTLGIRPGEPAAVVGAGAMGVLAMWVLKDRGARVAIIERSEVRRELASELGADAALSLDDDAAHALGDLPHAYVVAAPGAEALDLALRRVAVGGVVHAFAGTPGGAQIDANLVHYRHLRLVGSTGSNLSDMQQAIELVSGGAVPLKRLPVETIALEEVPAALEKPQDPRILKVLIDVQGGSR